MDCALSLVEKQRFAKRSQRNKKLLGLTGKPRRLSAAGLSCGNGCNTVTVGGGDVKGASVAYLLDREWHTQGPYDWVGPNGNSYTIKHASNSTLLRS